MKNTIEQKALEVERQQERLRAKELQLKQLEQKLVVTSPQNSRKSYNNNKDEPALQDEDRIKLHIAQEMDRLHQQLLYQRNTNRV
jgi:hypothetical protein